MARIVSISRVCSKQQDSYNNKSFVLYSKLWKRNENRGRHKEKRKGRESDRVCRKNEEGTGRGRAALKKAQEDMKRQADKGRKKSKD